jgi:cation:H+ antiporter
MDVLFIVAGIGLLYVGGDLLVRNSSLLARRWGIPPVIIGLTIVSFGTSAPELAASVSAALQGAPEISIGNVVGSNIANIALILGLTAAIHPLRAGAQFLKRDTPLMIGVAVLLGVLFLNGSLGRIEGAVFVIGLAGYLWLLLRTDETAEVQAEFVQEFSPMSTSPTWVAGGGALVGLVALVAGAQLLVAGATSIARAAGVPELIIGLTLVAVGTSLPELATSVIAALKREPDIALGNIVGSNIFNILGILGITVLVRPIDLPFERIAMDLAVMVALSVLLWPFLRTGMRLGRREGATLLGLYVAYVVFLYLR